MGIIQSFHLANVRILLELNHWLAQRTTLYELALALVSRWGDVLMLVTLALLWFWADPKPRDILQPLTFKPGGTDDKQSLWERIRAKLTRRDKVTFEPLSSKPPPVHLTRLESRAQILVFSVFATAIYVLTYLIAAIWGVDPPAFSYLPVTSGMVRDAFDNLERVGSCPAAHAAILGALPIALSYWNRPLALGWGVFAIVLAVAEVAVGYHFPADVLLGGIIGVVCMSLVMQAFDNRQRLYEMGTYTAAIFAPSNAPYVYFLYAFLVILGIEFLMRFQHIINFFLAFGAAFTQHL